MDKIRLGDGAPFIVGGRATRKRDGSVWYMLEVDEEGDIQLADGGSDWDEPAGLALDLTHRPTFLELAWRIDQLGARYEGADMYQSGVEFHWNNKAGAFNNPAALLTLWRSVDKGAGDAG